MVDVYSHKIESVNIKITCLPSAKYYLAFFCKIVIIKPIQSLMAP
jgi:hypothetical protein